MTIINWWIGATVSLSQSEYLVAESNKSLTIVVTLSKMASENVTIEVTLSDGSANGNLEHGMHSMVWEIMKLSFITTKNLLTETFRKIL